MTVNEIAQQINAEVTGDGGVTIRNVAKIEEAGEGDITFIANPKYARYLATTTASAVIIDLHHVIETPSQSIRRPAFLRVADPYAAFILVLRLFNPPPEIVPRGIHPSAVIPETARIGNDVRIGAHVVIGEHAQLAAGARIGHGTVIGDNVQIGEDTLLYPNVTVNYGCRIGARTIIHSGTVVGSDGFGFSPKSDGSYEKIPQTGIVVIEDDVEIGSNCSLDRATMGETRICRGVKLDNLIQIAHNVVVGENTVIAAQAGISGSTKIGKNCIIAGQVGIIGHLEIADRVTIGAQSGIPKGISKAGSTYFGYPAKERGRALRIEAVIRQLPEFFAEFTAMKRKLEQDEDKKRQ